MKTRSRNSPISAEEQRGATFDAACSAIQQAQAVTIRDTRASSLTQLQHRERAGTSILAAQLKAQAEKMTTRQLQMMPIAGGLPAQLKSGIESLSGMSMDHVEVHYNSDKPAQLNAHAFAQGSEIHIAAGQEQHLPHEAWHVVQQMQGRVRPTMQMKGAVPINDDARLETEADVMGEQAGHLGHYGTPRMWTYRNATLPAMSPSAQMAQNRVAQLHPLSKAELNVVGETHPETDARLNVEKDYCRIFSGSTNYWSENQFRVRAYSLATDFMSDRRARADPFSDRFEHVLLKAALTNPWPNVSNQNSHDIQNQVSRLAEEISDAIAVGILRFSRDLKIMIANLEADSDGYELTPPQKQRYIALKGDVNRLYERSSTCVNDLKGSGSVVGKITNLNAMCGNLTTLNTAFGALRSDGVVRISRSEAMNLAAEARSGEHGVWKIGERHRADIAGKDASYNLVTLDDFNQGLVDWRSETVMGERDAVIGQRGKIVDHITDEDL